MVLAAKDALGAVWQDPDFDPEQPAFYSVRILKISTPRWTTYDSAFYDNDGPGDVPAEIQERAYTSPIWYVPPNELHESNIAPIPVRSPSFYMNQQSQKSEGTG
jgi:hypothetical protein